MISTELSTIFMTDLKLHCMWWIYALLSALFAALTAIFAKVGVKDVNSDMGRPSMLWIL